MIDFVTVMFHIFIFLTHLFMTQNFIVLRDKGVDFFLFDVEQSKHYRMIQVVNWKTGPDLCLVSDFSSYSFFWHLLSIDMQRNIQTFE